MSSQPGIEAPDSDAAPIPRPVTTTARLVLRELVAADAPFIRALLNDPDWIRYIGDKGVRTDEDARGYLERGPIAMYARNGFGLYQVALRATGEAIGMCGLIKRDTLPDVDIGFAFLPAHRGHGYALESAAAVIAHGAAAHGLTRVVAIASPDNAKSLRLLERLGMTSEGIWTGSAPDDPLVLYARSLP
jgi:RimJ/RimL family protein N-acetyltransferase